VTTPAPVTVAVVTGAYRIAAAVLACPAVAADCLDVIAWDAPGGGGSDDPCTG
jgi:hypothetical protein